jgi:nitroimidazol reductase NimA-like FMN-containing flavoprotein (pyridoxamine 5'-phosphate oxidase superfamily)
MSLGGVPTLNVQDLESGKERGMTERTPVGEQTLVEGDAAATPWAEARARLETPERDRTYWLATAGPDGRPHIRPLLGLWMDDAFYFITGETTGKGKNLAANPQCALAVSSTVLPALDVMVEGAAVKVTDDAEVQRVAEAYTSTLQWPLTARDGAVLGPNAPTAGPPPYAVFKLTPTTVFGLPGIAGTDEGEGAAGSFTPTRWRF